MKNISLIGIVALLFTISSCDEDTGIVGGSITNNVDKFKIVADTFDVTSQSIRVDSVLSRSEYCYLGRIKDPETGAYITSNYMTQFTILEKEQGYMFPEEDAIGKSEKDGKVVADSCNINIIINKWQGDSLAAMKLTIYELEKPVDEGEMYYTNFDPIEKGYTRTDGGLVQQKMYSITDLLLSDTLRAQRQSGSYHDYISIPLNNQYKDKDGNEYENYGTYIMRNYFAHPEYFKNSYHFVHNVCPGFYFKSTDGLGIMSEIENTQLVIYYHFTADDSTYVGTKVFNGTEEIVQTNKIINDEKSIQKLVEDNSCTYLKTPAGLCTEVKLPIDDIKLNHESDSIMQAKIVFNCIKEQNPLSSTILTEPTQLLMIERDSLYSFFENNKIPDNTTSYLATYNSTSKTYSFNNISGLINYMAQNANKSENWNKVVLIPVKVTYTSSSSPTITSVSNEMSITSVRLVGGSENAHTPLRINVIYSKNK